MIELVQVDPNIPSGLSKLLHQGETSLNGGRIEQAVITYCKAFAWDSCVTETHLNTLSRQSFELFTSVLEDYCVWGFDTNRHFPMYDINLTLEELCDWLTKSYMKPNSLVAWETKVNIQMGTNRFDDVIKSCTHVLKHISSKETSFVLARATAHLHLRHNDEAIQDYVTAFDMNSITTSEYVRQRQSKSIDKIMEVFYELIDELKKKTESMLGDVDVNLRLVKCYQFVFMLRPSDVTSYLDCAYVMLTLDKPKDAAILLSEAKDVAEDTDSDTSCILVQRAEVYLTTGEIELSLLDYMMAMSINQELTQSSLQLLPRQSRSIIIAKAKDLVDNVLAKYRNQNKSCSPSCFVHKQMTDKELTHAYDCAVFLSLVDPSVDVILDCAECLTLQRKESKALEMYFQAINLNPKSVKTYCSRASCFASLGDFTNALRDYDYALSISPEDPRALCGKICTMVLVGQLEQSVEVLVRALANDNLKIIVNNIKELTIEQKDTFANRMTNFLKTSLKNSKVEDCKEDLCLVGELLTRVFPNDLDAHITYADLLLNIHKKDESQAILVRYVNKNPTSYRCTIHLALLKIRIGKTKIAVKELCSILRTIGEEKLAEIFQEIDPKVIKILAREVYLQGMDKGKTSNERIILLTLAIACNPMQLWICYFNRGKLHFSDGELDLALQDFTSALNTNSKHIPSYLMRALVLIRQLLWQESMDDILTAIQVNFPVLVGTIQKLPLRSRKSLLGVVLRCVQNYFSIYNSTGVKSAFILPLCLLLVQSDSSVSEYHCTLADAYFVFGNYQEATKELEITELLSPCIDTFVIGQLGLAHVKLNNFSAAVDAFCRMNELDENGLEFVLDTLNTDQRQTLSQQALNQANASLSHSDFADALRLLNLAVKVTKGQRIDVLRKRCECWIGLQSYSNALNDVTMVIDLGDVIITDYCIRASLLSRSGEFASACADVMKALDMGGNVCIESFKSMFPDLQLGMLFVQTAVSQYESKMYRQALKTCAYGLRLDPGDDELLNVKNKLESVSSHSCVIQ